MYGDEILELLVNYKCSFFIGVFALDELKFKIKKYPSCLIVNSHPRNMPGEHWLAIYIDENKNGRYFDSYGFPPLQAEFYDFMNNNCVRWNFSTSVIQSGSSISCGEFCTFYIASRSIGLTHKDVIELFCKSRLQFNDDLVSLYLQLMAAHTRQMS